MLGTIQHAQNLTQADFTGTVTVFNSSGGTVSAVATNLLQPSDWNSVHNFTATVQPADVASLFIIGSGMTSSTSTNGISVGFPEVNFFEPWPLPNADSTLSTGSIGTWYIDPFSLKNVFAGGRLNLFGSIAAGFLNNTTYSTSTASHTKYATIEHDIAIYSRDSGANSTRLTKVWNADADIFATWQVAVSGTSGTTTSLGSLTVTNALTISFPAQWDTSGGVTYSSTSQSGTVSSGSFTMANTRADSLITGAAVYVSGAIENIFGMTANLLPANYWFAHMYSTITSSTGTGAYSQGTYFPLMSFVGMNEFPLNPYKQMGKSVSSTNTNPIDYHGFINTGSSEAFLSLAATDVRPSPTRMYWNLFGAAAT